LENQGNASKDSLFFLKNMLAGTCSPRHCATYARYARSLIALYVFVDLGATAGVLGAVTGSPFFLVKTRMQAQTEYGITRLTTHQIHLTTDELVTCTLRPLACSVPALAVGHQYKYKNSFQYAASSRGTGCLL
jgi:hypothetical protein